MKYVDPDGRFLFTAIGAFVGGATAAIKGGSWSDIGKGALAGAVAGAVIDITIASGGAGGVLIAAGGISAMAGEATHQALYSKSDIGDILMAGGTGLAMGMFGEMAGPVFRSLKGVFKGKNAIVEFEPLSQGTILDEAIEITVSKSKYPEAAKHIEDAANSGISTTGKIDRAGAASRRREALTGTKTKANFDRDEVPPAVINNGGNGSSVRHIKPSDNRGAGASIGNQIRNLPDGTNVRLKTE